MNVNSSTLPLDNSNAYKKCHILRNKARKNFSTQKELYKCALIDVRTHGQRKKNSIHQDAHKKGGSEQERRKRARRRKWQESRNQEVSNKLGNMQGRRQ
jgi:hypothetical protein